MSPSPRASQSAPSEPMPPVVDPAVLVEASLDPADAPDLEMAAINGDYDAIPDLPSPSSNVDIKALAEAIVGAVTATQGPRKITAAEYQRERSIHRDKPQLTRKVYQNGYMLTRHQLPADAIHLANAIRPGIYANGTIQVVPMRDGTAGMSLDIRYANKSPDERMELKSRFPTFTHMLAAIVREQQTVTLA